MTTEQLKEMILSRPGLRNRNIDVARQLLYGKEPVSNPVKGRRIRQDRKGMNKLESQWRDILEAQFPDEKFRFGERRYLLANGIWYKPDFTCQRHRWPEEKSISLQYKETAWEVKGPKSWRGGFENLKVAAHQWPEVRWVLVWKDENGNWNEQEVLP